MTKKSWKSAIVHVLRDFGDAMSRMEIAEAIVSKGLREDVGSTPANTVASYISTSLSQEGNKSPFVRVGRGQYALRDVIKSDMLQNTSDVKTELTESGAINAFGMFWSRNLVMWEKKPQMLGQQQLGATPVDLGEQRGIYLLYDGRDVIYIGRAIDRSIGQRLFEHTQDRLRARWNRFSWFGIYSVTDKGGLVVKSPSVASDVFIAMLEAVLIEANEPPQNRKRGDDFSGIEYIQVEDTYIEKKRKLSILAQMQSKLLDV